jgi:hypothetical protein
LATSPSFPKRLTISPALLCTIGLDLQYNTIQYRSGRGE